MLLFRALARNMAPMTFMTTAPYALLNEVAPLCSLYSLVKVLLALFLAGSSCKSKKGAKRELLNGSSNYCVLLLIFIFNIIN